MMKPVKRVFLILGAMSMFSLFQFDAMAAQDCTNAPSEGHYCFHKNSKPKCPEGCWCEGGSEYHISDNVGEKDKIEKICRNKNATLRELRQLHYAKVYVCGIDYTKIQSSNGIPGFAGSDITYNTSCNQGNCGGIHMEPYSREGQDSVEDCGVRYCDNSPSAGFYCDIRKYVTNPCPKGCYCSGNNKRAVIVDDDTISKACSERLSDVNQIGFDIKKHLESRGVFYCPSAYISGWSRDVWGATVGAKEITDCVLKSDNRVHYELTCPSDRPLRQDDGQCVACQSGTEWVATQNACVSRHSVTYNCGSGTGTATADSHNYLVGETVTVKSKGSCQGLGGRVFNNWNCGSGIGTKIPGSSFTMPNNDVVCTAQWTAGSGGGNTGGNGTTCATGQYLVYGTAEPADITQRVDINPDDIEEVSPVSKRTNPNNNKAFAETNANNNKASGETKANLSRSVVSRAAKLTGFETSLSDVGQIAPKSALVGMGGTCKDCEAGYYCPDKKHRYRCGDGTYTSTTGQTSCQPCNGTVTHPANNSSLNTGCTPNPGDLYSVTYKCGEGSGTQPTDSNSYASGASVTLKSKGNCTAPSAKPNFDGWNCGNNISGQAGDTITMPAADVICTAQWKSLPPDTYAIIYYNVDNATWVSGENYPTTYTYGTSVTIGKPSRANYEFRGWCKGTDNCQQPVAPYVIAATDTGDLNLYAKWTCANGYVWGNGNICIPANNCDGEDQFIADDICYTCPANSSVNEAGDGCVNDSGQDVPPISPTGSVTCGTGNYVDDDGACQICPTGRFCPGNGNYYTCPFGSPTSNKDSCSFSLNESKLYHGQSTSGNCWKHLNNASNYRDCMYGFHLESLRGN